MTTTPPPAATAAAPPPVAAAAVRRPGAGRRPHPGLPPARPRPARAPSPAADGIRGRLESASPRCGRPWPAPRGGCGPWASSASPPPCCSGSRRARPSGPPTAPWSARPRTPTSSCASRPSRPTWCRPTPTPPTPSSSGGLEPAAQRADYTEAIATASGLIAQAAQHQPADGNALSALNQSLIAYTSQVEQARANNRQALPIGAQYLKGASADLRADALPLLANLGEANNARVTEEFDRAARAALWLDVVGLLALVVLALALVWLARRTRRYVNVPLAAAALVVLVTMVVGTVGLLAVKSDVDTTREGVYAATRSTAQARIAGFDAKSNESLTLIARGSGASFEKAWQASSAAVTTRARPARGRARHPRPQPAAVVRLRRRPPEDPRPRRRRRLGGCRRRWPPVIGAGTGNTTFAAFDTSSDEQLSALSAQTAQQLGDTGGWLPFAGVLGLLAGVIAALCAWWGVSLRLEEYR